MLNKLVKEFLNDMKIIENIKKFFHKYSFILYIIFFTNLILSETVYGFSCKPFSIFLKFIRYFCYVLLSLKFLIDWKNGKKSITKVQIIFFILIFLSFLFTKNTSLLLLFIILNAINEKDIINIIRINYKVYSRLFLIIVLLSLLGLIPDWIYYRGTIDRHSLGFYYPTITIGIYLSIVIMHFFLYHDKTSYLELLILELINVVLYSYTDGRMSFYLITLILIMILVSKCKFMKRIFNGVSNWKGSKVICMFVPFFLFIGTTGSTLLYKSNTTIGINLNNILSDRLALNEKAFENYGIPLFGDKIEWYGWGGYGYTEFPNLDEFEYNYVDMSYTRIIFDYGIIITLVILASYSLLLKKCYEEKKYWLTLSILFVLFWSCIEPNIVDFEKNIFVLYLCNLFQYGKIEKLDYKNIIKK